MTVPTFDEPLPYRSVIPAQRWLNVLTAVTLAFLVVCQVVWWPAVFGLLIPSLTVAVATPLLMFVPSGVIVAGLRRREWRRWADAHGFDYVRRPGWPVPSLEVAPFTIRRARRKRITDAMTGRVGVYPARYLHYRWVNNNRVNVSTHYRNVLSLELPRPLPALTIGPTISPDAGPTVPFESIDFNELWSVSCRDARFAKAAITPQTMDRLLALDIPVTAATRIVIVGRELLAISIIGCRAADITRLCTALRIIADGIPPYVWDMWVVDEGVPS